MATCSILSACTVVKASAVLQKGHYLRPLAASGSLLACRKFLIFGWLVATSVCSKGRSSSSVLNRLSRRLMSIPTCSQTLAFWTFSPVEFSATLPAGWWGFSPSRLRKFDFFQVLVATSEPVKPLSVLEVPNLSSSLILGQTRCFIFWLGASGTRVRRANSMPERWVWNSTSCRVHRTTFQSMESRWALASSARRYITQSVVDFATVSLSKPAQMRIHRLRQVLPSVLPRGA